MSVLDILTAPARMMTASLRSSAGGSIALVSNGNSCGGAPGAESARKLSAVFAAVDIRSNALATLPAYVMDNNNRERIAHPILELLSIRPNEAMTPAVRKKLLEESVLLTGNAYDWIIRDPATGRPKELIPVPGHLVQVWLDKDCRPWYDISHPITGEIMRLPNEDVCHYKGPSRDGYKGISILSYAQDTIRAGLAAQEYNTGFYESGGQPAGVLTVDADLSGYAKDNNGNSTSKTKKDVLRDEWERIHRGANNAHRIAVLDLGLKYQPLAISQRDSQFVEQQAITVQDIARFFGVPLYKLQAGSQSYNANEQNAIEFLSNLQPRVTQMEEEQTYKLLTISDRQKGLEIRYNMMAALRSDSQSRAAYYKSMWETGVYSVNDIRRLEDVPDVEGGNEHMASLNFVPLSLWRELSLNRNGGDDREPKT
jgi:HK97 family phage portal protein